MTTLHWIDYAIMVLYFAFVLGIGAMLRRYVHTSEDFFLSGRSIPAWVTGLAFISANLGAQEVIGMGASGAKYGIATSHFYWVGAIPAMVFVGWGAGAGGPGLSARLAGVAIDNGFAAGAYTRSWAFMGHASANPVGVEWFGLVMGLGFVLSFGYWCTDFLVVQRAMAANSMTAARRTPLIAAFPKMLFPFLVILPGMLALVVSPTSGVRAAAPAVSSTSTASPTSTTSITSAPASGIVPPKLHPHTGQPLRDAAGGVVLDYDLATPMMLLHFFPAGLLGLGLTALLASFMSGMAGNVTAFNTVWTYDLYQSYVRPGAPDTHYLAMGRFATVAGVAISIAAAYVAASFNNIMDFLQLVFAFVNAPLFATFALGMFWKRTTGHGAFAGLVAGTLAAAVHHGLSLPAGAAVGVKGGYLGVVTTFPSELAQTFWTAIVAWSTCFVVTILVSLVTKARAPDELRGLVYGLTPKPVDTAAPWYERPIALAAVVLTATVVLNLIFF